MVANPDLNRGDLAVPGDSALKSLQRHQYEIVLIHSHATLSFRREQPYDLAGDGLQANVGADGILFGEELLPDFASDDAHSGSGTDLEGSKFPAGPDIPVPNVKVSVVDAVNRGGPVCVAVDGLHRMRGCGRN